MTLSHATIWNAIDVLASQNGLSASGVARLSGLDPTAFNPSKRFKSDGRPRWPSTESIAKILDATDTTAQAFFRGDPRNEEHTSYQQSWSFCDVSSVRPAACWPSYVLQDKPTHEPVLKAKTRKPIGNTPSGLNNGLFTIDLQSSCFEPYYRLGDTLLLSKKQSIGEADRIVVARTDGSLVIGEVVSQSTEGLFMQVLGAASEARAIARSSIEWVARILWASQ